MRPLEGASEPDEKPSPGPARMSERRTSIIGALLVAIGPISMAIYTPAMPTLVHVFGAPESTIKLTLALYFAGFALAQLVCGPLSDAYGRRRITVVFMGIYLVGALIAALTPTVEWLLAARILQGVGASVGVATSRAIVRDQFVGEASSRIMNSIGIMLAVGPALAPTIGGIALSLSGWHAIFVVMIVFGLGVIGVTLGFMHETTVPDPTLAQPRRLLASYRRILGTRRFVAAGLTLGGTAGALYTLATVLPFVLIDHAGLTPAAFGFGMLGQSGLFFLGSVTMRMLIGRVSAYRLVLPGLVCVALASLALVASIASMPPSYASIMLPVGLYAFGIAFVMPAMTTAALAEFPDIAGAAAAVLGFLQMGMGLLGGLACASIGHPVAATAIVIPLMAAVALAGYAVFDRLPPAPLPEPRAELPVPDLVPLDR